jgi:hypothetical protein
MERTDIHRPSVIIPSDYEEVAVWTMNIQGLGEAEFMLRERETIRKHMEQTKGTYARVDTTGSCQVCGNVQAIYLVLFYHAKTNTYIRVGFDCTAKLGFCSNIKSLNLFRKNVANARENQAGKRKAIAILSDLNLIEAWDIFSEAYPAHSDGCAALGTNQFGDDNGAHHPCNCDVNSRRREFDRYEERTIRDIVNRLVQYGSISDKASNFIRILLKKIIDRPIIEAQRQAEKDAAGPVPVGRVTMTGEVIGLKEVQGQSFHYGDSGLRTKLIIKLENGSKVYGNRFNNLNKGDIVTFTATVEASKDDSKFGFYKRPTTKEVK